MLQIASPVSGANTISFPVRHTPSGGDVFTLQRREEGQMRGGWWELKMLTFSRERRLPTLPASLLPSLLCSLFLSWSPLCRLTGIKSWLLIKKKKKHPHHDCLLPQHTHSLLALHFSLFLFPPLFFLFPLFSRFASLPLQLPQLFTLFTSHLLQACYSIFSHPPVIRSHPFFPFSFSSSRLHSPPPLHLNSYVWAAEALSAKLREGEQVGELLLLSGWGRAVISWGIWRPLCVCICVCVCVGLCRANLSGAA